MTPRHILVIKLRYLGDVLLSTPALRALKAAYPASRLTVIVNRGTEDILADNPYVDEVRPLDKGSLIAQWRLLSDLRRRHVDVAIDLTDADRSAFLTWMSGAPIRIGFNDERRWRGRWYTTIVSGLSAGHRIERDLVSLSPLGVTATDRIPKLWLAKEDESRAEELLFKLGVRADRPIIVMQPGARYWFKAWPAERFAVLADRLTERHGCQILIGGIRAEEGLAQRVIQLTKSRPVSIAGLAGVKTFAAMLKRSALFIGNDSGAMHLAAAVGTPIVALFGPSNPAEWGPRGGRAHVIYKGLDCRACFHPTCERGEQNCMKLISVEEVMSAAVRFMDDGRISR